jgi:ectoine hydroxylase-related dioxygenase (phytanoyl-CoA dioxygenase family)
LLETDEVKRLRSEFDRLFPESGASHLMHTEFRDGIGGNYHAVYDLHRSSDAFAEVVRHPRLVELLAQITGKKSFRVLLDQIQYKPAMTGGWNGWHRDMPSFPLIRPYTALTAWVALDDATEENGCMQMVPGSHSWGDASDLAGDDWGLPHLPDVYHGHRVARVLRPVRAGHVHFHHEMTWHCSAPNKTRGKRRALAILFIGADDRYREGGRITFPLKEGESMAAVAPILLERPE